MERAIKSIPAALFKTLTSDRGEEMGRHVDIKVSTAVQFLFPRSPQPLAVRIEGEHQWASPPRFSLKELISSHSAKDLTRIAALLNDRPRKTLGNMKSSEKLAELVAMTA